MTALRVLYGAGGRMSSGITKGGRILPDARAARFSRLLLILALLFLPTIIAHAQGNSPASTAAAPSGIAGVWDRVSHTVVQPWVTFGLLVVGCLFLFHEMLTPKTWGFTGNAGTICIGLVIASQVTVGDTGWVGVLLLLAGLTLILLEVHLYPGVGVAIAGFILLFAGMFLSLGGTRNTLFSLSVTSVLIMVSGLAFLAYLPKSPAWQRHLQEMKAKAAAFNDPASLLGQSGTAVTALRPSGKAEFGGVQIGVVTEGEFLDAGDRLMVASVEGDRIVVESLEPHPRRDSDLSTTPAV